MNNCELLIFPSSLCIIQKNYHLYKKKRPFSVIRFVVERCRVEFKTRLVKMKKIKYVNFPNNRRIIFCKRDDKSQKYRIGCLVKDKISQSSIIRFSHNFRSSR